MWHALNYIWVDYQLLYKYSEMSLWGIHLCFVHPDVMVECYIKNLRSILLFIILVGEVPIRSLMVFTIGFLSSH